MKRKSFRASENIVNILGYPFKSEDKLFLDTNIWILIDGLYISFKSERSKIYTQAFKNIIMAKSEIYTDILIISEFINSSAKMAYEFAKKEGKGFSKGFKDFRNSTEFNPIAKNIGKIVNHGIIKNCQSLNKGFDISQMKQFVDEYAEGGFDFNDQVITEICKRDHFILVTDDGDFADSGIDILTANKKLLRRG